jgi:hypothetical protein
VFFCFWNDLVTTAWDAGHLPHHIDIKLDSPATKLVWFDVLTDVDTRHKEFTPLEFQVTYINARRSFDPSYKLKCLFSIVHQIVLKNQVVSCNSEIVPGWNTINEAPINVPSGFTEIRLCMVRSAREDGACRLSRIRLLTDPNFLGIPSFETVWPDVREWILPKSIESKIINDSS